MTRKTPSRTKRELEKLRRGRDDDSGGPREITLELGGVPNEDSPPSASDPDAAASFEYATIDLENGEVETPGFPDPETAETCSTDECENAALPEEFGVSSLAKCGSCLGIPDRDVPPAFRDGEEGAGDDYA